METRTATAATATTTTATTTSSRFSFSKKKIVIGWMLSSFLLFLSFSDKCFVSAFRRLPTDVHVLSSSLSSDKNKNNNDDYDDEHEHVVRKLIGKQVDVPVPSSPDDHLVTDLPLLDEGTLPTDHWAGLLPASDDGHKYFFYWLFAPSETESKPDEDIPLIIWLNGGPACSSMDGLWLENGPLRLKKVNQHANQWKIEVDPNSWHNAPAYVVYIDQPVGTGLAFTTNGQYPRNDEQVNIDFYYFLKEFLTLHSDKFLKNDQPMLKRPLYFSGESHAGHYIPSMMNYIRKQNMKLQDDIGDGEIHIALAGAAIGNGWIDPRYQYSAHEAAYGHSLIGRAQSRYLAEREKKCQTDLANQNYVSSTCFGLLNSVVDNAVGKRSGFIISTYDSRKYEVASRARDFPPGHKDVESYLGGGSSLPPLTGGPNINGVLEAIHSLPSWMSGQRYQECTDPPYNALKHQDGLGVTGDIIDLLNDDMSLLFFNGIYDLICNHVGNEIALENLVWKNQKEYQLAKRFSWKSPTRNTIAGYMKQHGNLKFLKVLDSGHMVPMDVPDIALDMIRAFVYDTNFNNFEQQINRLEIQEGNNDNNNNGNNCPICPTVQKEGINNNECPQCTDCSTISNDDDVDDDNEHDDESTTTTITLPFSNKETKMYAMVIGIGISLCILCFCFCSCCFCRNSNDDDDDGYYGRPRRNTRGRRRNGNKRQVDMELARKHGGYSDQPNGYKDNDNDDDELFHDEINDNY